MAVCEASAGRQFCLALREWKISVLVPQPWWQVYPRTSREPDHGIPGQGPGHGSWAAKSEEGPNGMIIEWSQPEILLYDDDPLTRMSYPDLVEDQDRYYITETQKDIARVHEIHPGSLWAYGTSLTTGKKRPMAVAIEWDFEEVQFPFQKKVYSLIIFL